MLPIDATGFLTYYVVPIIALTAAVMGAFVIVTVTLNYRKHHSVGGNAWVLIIVALLLFGFSFWQSFEISASGRGFSMKVRAKLADIVKKENELTDLLAAIDCVKNPADSSADQRQQKDLQNLINERQQLVVDLTSLLERGQDGGKVILVHYDLFGHCWPALVAVDEISNFKKSHKLC